jgi:hypothetical protein
MYYTGRSNPKLRFRSIIVVAAHEAAAWLFAGFYIIPLVLPMFLQLFTILSLHITFPNVPGFPHALYSLST